MEEFSFAQLLAGTACRRRPFCRWCLYHVVFVVDLEAIPECVQSIGKCGTPNIGFYGYRPGRIYSGIGIAQQRHLFLADVGGTWTSSGCVERGFGRRRELKVSSRSNSALCSRPGLRI